jgi:hypothetical protein
MSELNLQQEIAKIEQDLAAKRVALEKQRSEGQIEAVPHEKETLREMIGEQIRHPDGVFPAQPPVPTSPITPAAKPGEDTPSYMTDRLNSSVRQLIEIAFSKSIDDAISTAKNSGNAALIDAFHDALVDELYNNLIEYRKLKKI